MTGLGQDPEFDFDFLFEFTQSDEGAAAEHYGYAPSAVGPGLPLGAAHPALPAPCHDLQAPNPIISVVPSTNPPSGYAGDSGPPGYFLPAGHTRPNGAPALESPRIEITPYLGLHPGGGPFFHDVDVEDVLPPGKRAAPTATLSLPNLEAYRDPSCLSPAGSLSSRSCNSEASSYESNYSFPYASPQTSPWQSPCVSPKTTDPDEGFPRGLGACTLLGSPRHSPSASPRASVTEESWLAPRGSRPSSPCNKRKYSLNGRPSCSPLHSPTPSPQGSPRVSVTDDTWLGSTTQYTSSAIVAAINALSTDGSVDLGDGVPVKSRKTALEHAPAMALKVEPAAEEPGSTPPAADFPPEEFPAFQHLRKGVFCDQYLSVPQHPYPWAKPKPLSPAPYMSPPLPALDWQLPSLSGPYELRIEVQPKSHHRAHYETEGSRGAVKASAGGHPVVQLHGYLENEPLTLQLFIGTADDRLLRPHAFYQVHRITGKTVSTSSHEAVLANTKVLEIPLLPENSMRAIIDCAGILKLRNSDIELRKGETDIGRKNTRVRLVFRVHIPQPGGRTLSLQAASSPIECSQRSAQELPLVEKQSTDSFPVVGGKKMVLSGHNFLRDSKVIFVEKAPDGHHVWEMEAKTDRDVCKPNSLVVEVPPFRNQRITSPVQVHFYVCNGKRKRSQYQPFTYLPAHVPMIKAEPADDYEPAPARGPAHQGLSPLTEPGFGPQLALLPGPASCLAASFVSCQQRSAAPSPPPSTSRKLHDLSAASYGKCVAGPGHSPLGLQPLAGGAPALQEGPGPVGAHTGSPGQPGLVMLQPQVSPRPSSRCPLGYRQALYPDSPSPPLLPARQEPGRPLPCSPPRPQPPLPKAPRDESPAARPPSRPELREDGDPAAAPAPAMVKREPQGLDQLYLDDVNEIIRNDLCSTNPRS
ncbi:nuclear factor of activated T-cells, cytoplasmic 1 isoform X5 [Dasypus novemcinctus]|uniref:nuclear factor of activated T-cells, cytoplasmic 1 isoform X5 n=2 Tax=Dasypus novemcinctus TaxID=9361 RepID=UPI00265E0CD3|nr:nuclear factor of activated T-cells, cytoplasmic 1 isoform X2 [Dasypus novemcinctus]